MKDKPMFAQSQRTYWTNEYPCNIVHAAAKEKAKFHTERLAFWKDRKLELEEELRVNGTKFISPDLGQLILGGSQTYAQPNTQVQIDQKLYTEFQLACKKVDEHTQKVDDYERWTLYLGTYTVSKPLELTFDDYQFFFGK